MICAGADWRDSTAQDSGLVIKAGPRPSGGNTGRLRGPMWQDPGPGAMSHASAAVRDACKVTLTGLASQKR
jgi:hypothetical protein